MDQIWPVVPLQVWLPSKPVLTCPDCAWSHLQAGSDEVPSADDPLGLGSQICQWCLLRGTASIMRSPMLRFTAHQPR